MKKISFILIAVIFINLNCFAKEVGCRIVVSRVHSHFQQTVPDSPYVEYEKIDLTSVRGLLKGERTFNFESKDHNGDFSYFVVVAATVNEGGSNWSKEGDSLRINTSIIRKSDNSVLAISEESSNELLSPRMLRDMTEGEVVTIYEDLTQKTVKRKIARVFAFFTNPNLYQLVRDTDDGYIKPLREEYGVEYVLDNIGRAYSAGGPLAPLRELLYVGVECALTEVLLEY